MADADFISVKDAAAIIGMSASRLSVWCAAGRVPAQRIGHSYILPRDWVGEERRRRAKYITQTEAARRLGLSRQRVGQMIRAGKLTLVDGRIPADEVAREMEARNERN